MLFAAILPLVAVVGINDLLARKTLEQQGRAALTTDAQSKASLVELYLHERVLDGRLWHSTHGAGVLDLR